MATNKIGPNCLAYDAVVEPMRATIEGCVGRAINLSNHSKHLPRSATWTLATRNWPSDHSMKYESNDRSHATICSLLRWIQSPMSPKLIFVENINRQQLWQSLHHNPLPLAKAHCISEHWSHKSKLTPFRRPQPLQCTSASMATML